MKGNNVNGKIRNVCKVVFNEKLCWRRKRTLRQGVDCVMDIRSRGSCFNLSIGCASITVIDVISTKMEKLEHLQEVDLLFKV